MQLVERIGANTLRAIAPAVTGSKKAKQAAIIAAVGPAMPELLTRYDITTARRIEHFLAQAAHESAGFTTTEELGGASYFARYDGRSDLGNTKAGDGAYVSAVDPRGLPPTGEAPVKLIGAVKSALGQ